MMQAESNVIKMWRFCWLHPPRENDFVSSWQISNEKKLPPPLHKKIILSRGDREKQIAPPHHEKIILSCGDIEKQIVPPHHEKIILSRRDKS